MANRETTDYAAPEVLQGKAYGGKEQDVWALGILLYTIVYKENPFYNIGMSFSCLGIPPQSSSNLEKKHHETKLTTWIPSQTKFSTTHCEYRTCHSARAVSI